MNDDNLIGVIAAAAMFRATELAHGNSFTNNQIRLYIENYEGKYSKEIVRCGITIFIKERTRKHSFIDKLKYIFGSPDGSAATMMAIEEQAESILKAPGIADRLRRLVADDFRRSPLRE